MEDAKSDNDTPSVWRLTNGESSYGRQKVPPFGNFQSAMNLLCESSVQTHMNCTHVSLLLSCVPWVYITYGIHKLCSKLRSEIDLEYSWWLSQCWRCWMDRTTLFEIIETPELTQKERRREKVKTFFRKFKNWMQKDHLPDGSKSAHSICFRDLEWFKYDLATKNGRWWREWNWRSFLRALFAFS